MKKVTLVLNSHSLDDYLKCPKRFDYTQIKGIEPADAYRPFARGTVVTNLVSWHYQGKLFGPYTSDPLGDLEKLLHSDEIDEDDRRLIRARFGQYCKHYQNESWIPLAVEKNGVLDHPENKGTGFSRVLYESDNVLFVYEGEPDLIVQLGRTKDTDRMVVDTKSQSRKTPIFEYLNQFRGYCWATGINNFCVNIFGLQASGDEKLWFNRQIITFQPKQIEQWRNDTISACYRILSAVVNKNYSRTWQCEGKYGVCHYFPLCKSSYLPFIEQDKIKREYKLKERKASW